MKFITLLSLLTDFLKLRPCATDISAVVLRLVTKSLRSKFEMAKKCNVSKSDDKKSDVGKFLLKNLLVKILLEKSASKKKK